MPGPLSGLKNAIQQRKEAQEAASGGLGALGGVPMPVSSPQTPSPMMGGLQAAAPREEMSPADRAQFAQDTGIQSNPGAADINLGIDPVELARRADALINRFR